MNDFQRREIEKCKKLEEKKKEFEMNIEMCIKKVREGATVMMDSIPTKEKKQKIIFDTDIGSDIDDSLALLLLLHLPQEDYELLGITTVYGYVGIRSEVVRKIIEAHELNINKKLNIPVLTGSNATVSENKIFEIWHSNTEGIGLFKDDEISTMMKNNNCYINREDELKYDCLDAAKFIVEKVMEYPNEITIVSLGAMTNISKSLKLEPKIVNLIRKITFMGSGVVPYHQKIPEKFEMFKEYHCHSCHNIRTDPSAAQEVFSTTIPIYTIGHTVTHDMWFSGDTVEEMRKLSFHKGLNAYTNDQIFEKYHENYLKSTCVVGTLLDVWLKHRCQTFKQNVDGTCPHDALTTMEALYSGEYINYVQGHLIINESNGDTCFIYDPNGGTKFISIGWKENGVSTFMKILNEGMMKMIKW